MAMPMQISLEEVITMLLSRVESLAMNDENNKTKFNIMMRVLYKKGIITDADVRDSVVEEHKMLVELGMIPSEPEAAVTDAIVESIMQWIRGDVPAIKKSMEEYDKKIKEMQREEATKPKLAVASSDVLQQLDNLTPPPGSGKGGSRLII